MVKIVKDKVVVLKIGKSWRVAYDNCFGKRTYITANKFKTKAGANRFIKSHGGRPAIKNWMDNARV